MTVIQYMKTFPFALIATGLFAVVGCSEQKSEAVKESAGPLKAIATLAPTQGNNVKGSVTFTEVADGVRVEAEITGLTPGKHGFHVHEKGDCSAPDATSAGEHFNPTGKPHAAADQVERHDGDMGNIEADASGAARLNYVDHTISLVPGDRSVIGRAVLVHADPDDLTSQPSGNAGARVACGVINKLAGSANSIAP
jgi:Cu-Zn family superoxide dismutase